MTTLQSIRRLDPKFILATLFLIVHVTKVVTIGNQEPDPPAKLYLGLYSRDSENRNFATFVRDLNQHSCTNFTPTINSSTETCKYYGDCCTDPIRLREKLEPGTFSCQTLPSLGSATFYIVDKCPSQTEDQELSSLCSKNDTTDHPALHNWLVTATHSGVTYKNIYCAICHGAHQLPGRPVGEGIGNLTAVDFWWSELRCNGSSTDELVKKREEVNREEWLSVLNEYVMDQKCTYRFTPSLRIAPHQCLPAVRTCPPGYADEEMVEMCQLAPADYRTGTDGNLYRNRFCQLCNGLVSLPELSGVRSFLPPTTTPPAPLGPSGEPITIPYLVSSDISEVLLTKLKPNFQLTTKTELSVDDLGKPSIPDSINFLSMTNNISESYFYSTPVNSSASGNVWNFGSIWCESSYVGVCDGFIKLPEEGCSGPGCGEGSWQHLNGSCESLSMYRYNVDSKKQQSLVWPTAMYGRYYSSCNQNAQFNPERNCRCDTRCHYFGECCFDAENFSPVLPAPLKYTCMPISRYQRMGSAVVSECPDSADADMAELCSQGDAGSWSPYGWPVYDPVSKLSFKNIFCAECHGVKMADSLFWTAIMDCSWQSASDPWQTCSFRAYKHPITDDSSQPYWCYTKPIVSTCPSDFAGWKVNEDCRSGPNAWVYHNETIYKNSHCAVCNLGDEITQAQVDGLFSDQPKERVVDSALQKLDSPADFDVGLVTLNINNNKCVYNNIITNASFDVWGSIKTTESCKKFPFNISCQEPNTWMQTFASADITPTDLCAALPTPSEIPTLPEPYLIYGLPKIVSDPPSFAEFFFSDVGEIPEEYVANSSWEMVNKSIKICFDGTAVEPSSGSRFNRFRLSPSGIEVRDVIITTDFKIELQIHDYVLIALSLLFIFFYIIWLVTRKDKMNVTKLMIISLLVSLFCGLLSFSLSTIPVNQDVTGCRFIAAFEQFVFLSTFFWANSLAIDITYTIYSFASKTRSKKRFIIYFAYAFGLPLLLTLIAFGVYLEEDNLNLERSVYRKKYLCFLNNRDVIYSLFLGPIYVIILCNLILCIASVARVTRKVEIASNDKDRTKKNVITCVKLIICLGVGWVLLFPTLLLDSLWPVFLVFMELQGILIVTANLIGWDCVKKIRSKSQSWFSSDAGTNVAANRTELTSLNAKPSPLFSRLDRKQ